MEARNTDRPRSREIAAGKSWESRERLGTVGGDAAGMQYPVLINFIGCPRSELGPGLVRRRPED